MFFAPYKKGVLSCYKKRNIKSFKGVYFLNTIKEVKIVKDVSINP